MPRDEYLRIAFVVSSFPEVSETFLLRQVTGLLERGHFVRIIAEVEPKTWSVHEEYERHQVWKYVRYLRPSAGHRKVRWGRALALMNRRHPYRMLRLLYQSVRRGVIPSPHEVWRWHLAVSETLNDGGYDIVHCHYGDVGLRFRFLADLWQAPLIVSFYGYDCSVYPKVHGPEVFRSLFAVADAVAVLGPYMADRVVRLGCPADCIRVVRLSVDPDVFPYRDRVPANERPVRLLTVARLVPKKGVDIALRAIAIAASQFGQIRYDVIGAGPLREHLEELARLLGISNMVQFHGAQVNGVVRRFFDDADIFVLPSRTAENGDEEGTPTVLIEACSTGLPVLSTRHSGIPEVVLDGKSGYLVPENDPLALAKRLLQLLADQESWSIMGRTGREHVEEHFTLKKISTELESLYVELLDRGETLPSGTRGAPAH